MQINKNRKGLALGAALSLLASVFVGAAPASANTDGAYIALTPAAGPVTNFNGTLAEDFQLISYVLPGEDEWTDSDVVFHEVTLVSGDMNVTVVAGDTPAAITTEGSANGTTDALLGATTESVVVSSSATTSGVAYLNVFASTASGILSSSPTVTLLVKTWKENSATANGEHDSLEWFTTKTVVLHSLNAIPATTTLTAVAEDDAVLTVSATVTALNFANLSGSFFLQVEGTDDQITSTNASSTFSAVLSTADMVLRAGVVSSSFAISTSALAGASFSAQVRYSTDSPAVDAGFGLGALATQVAAAATVERLFTQIPASNNSTSSSGTVAVRPNQTYTIHVGANSGSPAVSISGAVISVAMSGPTLTLPNRYISINGGAATTSYPAALSVTTGANGFGSFTLMTSGITDSEQITITATQGNVTASTLNLVATAPAYSIVNDYDLYSTTPGSAVTVGFSVEDQYGVDSPRTDQRIQVTRGGTGFNYATTVSTVAVVGGEASFAFTPAPAAATGSATLNTVLQQYDQDLGIWETVGSAGTAITVNVTSATSVFSTASAVLSQSASISYSVSDGVFIWTPTVTVGATGAGVDVAVSAPGLYIKNVATDVTSSGALVVRSNSSKNVEVQFASNIAGTYTVTYTLGAGSTTSTVVISPAASDSGTAISFDTTNIPSGSTKTITGTLVDMFGNPVETVGSASILVTYVGTGIVVGTMPTETDDDGQFAFSVLVGSNDSGTALVTASYYKEGASTAVKDVLTATQQVTIGGAAAETPASDQKLTVGSFKGFVAIYALNYTGQKLSAKVAGKWLVVNELTRFQRVVRNTGAGYTIKVDLHIDGEFVRTETVVTK